MIFTVEYGEKSIYKHIEELGYDVQRQPVLEATAITLGTLAPARYYSNYNLKNLGHSLSNGLTQFGENFGLDLNFEFNKFGPAYDGGLDPKCIQAAVITRNPVICVKKRGF